MFPSWRQSIIVPGRRRRPDARTGVPAPVRGEWYKSSLSGADGCVEIRWRDTDIQVRDSKDPNSPVLTFTPKEWSAFVGGVNMGEFGR